MAAEIVVVVRDRPPVDPLLRIDIELYFAMVAIQERATIAISRIREGFVKEVGERPWGMNGPR